MSVHTAPDNHSRDEQDRHSAEGDRVIRHLATDPTHRLGSLFTNGRAPSEQVDGLGSSYQAIPAALRASYDIVSFDSRGTVWPPRRRGTECSGLFSMADGMKTPCTREPMGLDYHRGTRLRRPPSRGVVPRRTNSLRLVVTRGTGWRPAGRPFLAGGGRR